MSGVQNKGTGSEAVKPGMCPPSASHRKRHEHEMTCAADPLIYDVVKYVYSVFFAIYIIAPYTLSKLCCTFLHLWIYSNYHLSKLININIHLKESIA